VKANFSLLQLHSPSFPVRPGIVDLDLKCEDAHDRRIEHSAIARRIVGEVIGAVDPLVEIQPKLKRPTLLACRGERFPGASSMGAHTMLLALADLDPRRGQLDQSFEQVGRSTPATVCVPEPFPDLVCFPIISGVEQLDGAEE
jgi:hypothetical protein